jgi:hypothetical protein
MRKMMPTTSISEILARMSALDIREYCKAMCDICVAAKAEREGLRYCNAGHPPTKGNTCHYCADEREALLTQVDDEDRRKGLADAAFDLEYENEQAEGRWSI